MRMDSIGVLWGKAWRLYADRFGVLMGILIAPMLLLGLGNIFQVIGFPFTIAGSVVSLVGAILSIIGNAAIIYSLQNKADFAESYNNAWKFFWALLWVAVLVVLAFAGSMAMLIIPGIWLAIMLVFTNFTLVLENKKGTSALLQSYAYVKDYWWAVLGRFILLILLLFAAHIVLDIPFGIIGGSVGRTVSSAVILLFFAPFSVAYYFSMYENLAALKQDVRNGTPAGGKTFVRISQIVGVVVILLLLIGFVLAAANRGSYHGAANFNVNGYYGPGGPTPTTSGSYGTY